jgi:hypothetical protein
MNTDLQVSDAIIRAIEHPSNGVLGVVDELLDLCPKQGLRLEWRTDRCCLLLPSENGQETSFPVSIRKSVLRAILARLAALCNVRAADSVSLYGGEGAFSVADPDKGFRIAFVNTPAEQKLELLREDRPTPVREDLRNDIVGAVR